MKKNNGICYCFAEETGGKYALTFTAVKKGIHTGIEIGIIDFSRKEKLECTEYILNSDIKRLSSFNVESKNFSFSIEDNGSKKLVKADFKKCLSHTELKAELLVTLSFSKHEEAFESVGFVNVCGTVFVKGREYSFKEASLGVFFTSLNVPKGNRLIGFGKTGESPLAVVAYPETNGKLTVFKNGKKHTFYGFAIEKGDFKSAWDIHLNDESEKVSFLPSFNDRVDISRGWLNIHGNLFFGRLSGKLSFDEDEVSLEDVKCLYGISN